MGVFYSVSFGLIAIICVGGEVRLKKSLTAILAAFGGSASVCFGGGQPCARGARMCSPRQYHWPSKPCTCQQPLAGTATPARPCPVHPNSSSKAPAQARVTQRTVKGRTCAFKERPRGRASPAPGERRGAELEWAWPQRQYGEQGGGGISVYWEVKERPEKWLTPEGVLTLKHDYQGFDPRDPCGTHD